MRDRQRQGLEATSRLTFVRELRSFALGGLPRMFRADEGLYAFRVRRNSVGVHTEGVSRRYTAITVIGLATEPAPERALGTTSLRELCERLIREIPSMTSLGDVALTLWACALTGHGDREVARARLLAMSPDRAAYPTVEVAWALAATCFDAGPATAGLRSRLSARLIDALGPSSVFPHVIGAGGGWRAHVSCFADMVYPIQALAHHHRLFDDRSAIDAASRAADFICRHQGPAGQWWWHYDCRTGSVIEPYPVYAVHQDAMGPMALFAVQDASGRDFAEAVARSLDWLRSSPELDGGSLVDAEAKLIWRKVARAEPGKLSRYLQATASRIHAGLRVPFVDALFRPGAIDYEDRPYHLGWLLHAFPENRAVQA